MLRKLDNRVYDQTGMKALLVLLLVVIFCGAGFFIGWIQPQLPANSYAVLHTKTNGVEDDVIQAGEFTWRWQRLIPKNTTLHVFELAPFRTEVEMTGTLPSGVLYSDYLPDTPDFSFDISFAITLTLVPEELPMLVSEHGITGESVQSWYESEAQFLAQMATEFILQIEDPADLYDAGRISEQLRSHVQYAGEAVEVIDIRPVVIHLPDLDLYLAAKQAFMEISRAQKEARTAAIRQLEPQRERERQTIAMLQEYGRLLSEYPVLVDFIGVLEKAGKNPGYIELNLPDVLGSTE